MSELKTFLGHNNPQFIYWCKDHYGRAESTPLCFTALEANSTITLARLYDYEENLPIAPLYPELNLQYSFDNITWSEIDFTKTPRDNKITLHNINDKMYVKAVTENLSGFAIFQPVIWNMTGKIAASGNIQYLLKSDGSILSVPEWGFNMMFVSCSALTLAPDLCATILSEGCYSDMFWACTLLTSAPELPATILADECYEDMFSDCSSLINIPFLPATTLSYLCYAGMFYNCTNLKISEDNIGKLILNIPPETTAATSWNTNMFDGTSGTFIGKPEIGKAYYVY